MSSSLTLTRRAAVAVLVALALSACGSGSDSADSTTDAPVDQPPPDPQDQVDDPTGGQADLPRIEFGDTFIVNTSGVFEGTYQGLADLGLADTNGNGQVQCYAVLAELTLVEADEFGASLSVQNEQVLGVDGTEVGTFETLGCDRSALSDNGYADAFGVDWAPGITELVAMDVIAVPAGDEDLMDRVQLYPNSAEFELAATTIETFPAG